jgi:mRNA interferase MazF
MQRGEVWWSDQPQPVGRRPVVLISRDRALQVRTNVTVVQITTTIRHIASEVPLGSADGLPRDCVANCDVIQTIPKHTLKEKVSLLSEKKRFALDAALRFSLDLTR